METGKAIKAWRDYRGLSQEKLGERAGITRQTVYVYEAEERSPNIEILDRIVAALGLSSVDEFRAGPPEEHALPQRNGITKETDTDAPREVHTVALPLYETVPAGGWSAHVAETDTEYRVLRHLARHDGFVVVRVEGDSMYPRFLDGDLVLVDTTQKKPRSGQVVVALYRGQTTMKRYRRIRGAPVLMPDNPDHKPMEIEDPGDLVVLGVVMRLVDRDASKAIG
jgi:repressor LexA